MIDMPDHLSIEGREFCRQFEDYLNSIPFSEERLQGEIILHLFLTKSCYLNKEMYSYLLECEDPYSFLIEASRVSESTPPKSRFMKNLSYNIRHSLKEIMEKDL